MRRENLPTIVGLGVLLIASSLIYLLVRSGAFTVCSPAVLTDGQTKTIASLDSLVDLGLKLSTALVGFGAAVLIGLKSGLQMTRPIRFTIVIGTLLFAQSALYGFWWRLGIATVHLEECFDLLTAPLLQYRFNAHFYFFMAGLVTIGLLVIGTLLRVPETEKDADT